MCKWGDEVRMRVPIPASCSYTEEFRWDVKPVDRCISPIVRALNGAGIYTGGSCCGHGKYPGNISLHDGTILTITHRDPKDAPCASARDEVSSPPKEKP